MGRFLDLALKAQDEIKQEVEDGNARHLRRAISLFEEAFADTQDEKSRNYRIALNEKSYAHYYLGQFEKALECLEKIASSGELEYFHHVNFATIFDDLGEEAKAQQHSFLAMKLNLDDSEVYSNFSAILFTQGNYVCASILADIAIGKDPNDFHGYANRGIAFAHLGKLDEAIADTQKAIELSQGKRYSLFGNLGSIHSQKGNLQEAEKNYRYVLDTLKAKEAEDFITIDYYAAIIAERGMRKLGLDPGTDFERQGLESGIIRKDVLAREIKELP